MEEHIKKRHGHRSEKTSKTNGVTEELTIPATPFLGLDDNSDKGIKHDKHRKRSERDTREHSDRRNSNSKSTRERKGGEQIQETKTHARDDKKDKSKKENRQNKDSGRQDKTQISPEKLTDTTTDGSFSNMSSPVSILLGLEDHPDVSPVRKDLSDLFGSPIKAVSPLPPTPKKPRKETSSGNMIVIEDETLEGNSLPQSDMCPILSFTNVQSVSRKRDSTHLMLPNPETVKEGKRWNRFLAPPSTFMNTEKSAEVKAIRDKAVKSDNYHGSVIPMGYAGVKKEEKVVFSDGTIYVLSAFWMANPTCALKVCDETQTELSLMPSNQQSVGTITEPFLSENQDDQLKTEKNSSVKECVSVGTQTQNQEDDIRVVELLNDLDYFSYYS